MFIDCYNNIQISYYGHSILQAYIPSIGRGNNIIKAIQNDGKADMILNIEKTDAEILFRFHSKHMKDLEKYLRPKTSGANISPYSTKNLPKNKEYKIPENDLIQFKVIISNLPKEQMVLIGKFTKDFLKSIATRKFTYDDMKADMAVKGLRGKDYVHCICKWNEYLSYLEENLPC